MREYTTIGKKLTKLEKKYLRILINLAIDNGDWKRAEHYGAILKGGINYAKSI